MSERSFDLTDPGIYGYWVEDTVRWSDQDAAGHINNTAHAAYIEGGRVGFVRDRIDAYEGGGRVVAARVAIDYLREAHYPGTVRVGTRLIRIGTRSFGTGHAVFKDGLCLAKAECVVVYMQGPQSAPIPGPLRSRLEALLAE